jgi:hypothetical protein
MNIIEQIHMMKIEKSVTKPETKNKTVKVQLHKVQYF